MRLYLVRHGDAVSKETDPTRPLSDPGRACVRRLGTFLAGSGVQVARVIHSGKRRAAETAELLAPHVCPSGHVDEVTGLGSMDPVAPFARAINDWTDDTVVVSHLPFIGSLLSQLVIGNDAASTVLFQTATVVCLARTEDQTWTILWALSPELLVPPAK
ncbi:MAG: phosphohistidine phosphatase SixA [Phycisphaerae bacterium]